MRIYTLLLLFFPAFILKSQTPACDCATEFERIQEKIRINYPGYKDKVNSATEADFQQFTAQIKAKAAQSPGSDSCFQLMRIWINWFHDAHMGLSLMPATAAKAVEDTAALRARYAGGERINLDENAVKTRLSRPDRDPLEGIYINDTRNYRVALLREPGPGRDYTAVVLKADGVYWMPGQVKFNLKRKTDNIFDCQYLMRDHSLQMQEAEGEPGILFIRSIGWFAMEFPEKHPNLERGKPVKSGNFALKALDAKTLYLRIGTMNENYRWEFKKLLKDNKKLLKSRPYWIIDVRGNGGGSDITYYPLRKYLYTQTVRSHRINLYATRDNAEKFRAWSENRETTTWYERLYVRYLYKKMLRHEGQFIGKNGLSKSRRPFKRKYPRKVVVLQDKRCGSSCEQFVLYAQQSKKVTLMGTNTFGVLDYGNLHALFFNNGRWELHYPTSRSTRVDEGKGIDNIGIPAEIPLEPGADWMAAALKYLNAGQCR